MKDYKKTIGWFKYFVIAAAIAIGVFSIYSFIVNVSGTIKEQAMITLRDTSKQVSEAFNRGLEDKLGTLSSIARFAGEEEDMVNSENLRQLMLDAQLGSDYLMVFAADQHGNTLTTNNAKMNISDQDYFKQAMKGKNSISDLIQGRMFWEKSFIMGTPIVDDNIIKGAIFASVRLDIFKNTVNTKMFEGYGYTYIFSNSGDIIVYPDSEYAAIKKSNIFDYFEETKIEGGLTAAGFANDVRSGYEGFFSFNHDGHLDYAYYAPLGINGWYTLCAVKGEVIEKQTTDLYELTLLLCIGLGISFLMIMGFLIINHREQKRDLEEKNRELLLNDKRFRLVSSLSNNIIFEWDILNDTTIFPNGFERIMGYQPSIAGFPESAAESGNIHPEYAESFIKFHRELPNDATKISGDFRVKSRGNKYIWCRFEELLMRDDSGKVIKSIAMMTDIDSQKKALDILKSKTQIDGGSGLYNKKATELLVSECLEKEKNGTHALLVIDIDDFKLVNDKKGHLYGDQVVTDVSNMLKELFRSSDIIGRIGGDEFMVLIRDIPNETFVASKISKLFKNIKTVHEITVSVGIALYPKHGTSYNKLYNNADTAMYKAKASGKKCFVFFSDSEEQLKKTN